MDASRIELNLVLEQLGLPNAKLDSFSERFNVQKRVYLTQIMGYDLGYHFNWYLRGPYSRHLTEDAFTMRDELSAGDKDADNYELSTDGVTKIKKALELCALPKTIKIEQDKWLELLASLHYLKHIAYWDAKTDKNFDAVFAKLVDSKPHFSGARAEAQSAWNRLGEFGLIAHTTAA